jgi:flagellar motor switch protein FliM
MQPQFANVAAPSEMVVTSSVTLEIGDTTGTVHLCFPYATLEPIRDVLYSSAQGGANEPDQRWIALLKGEIQSAQVELVATLATAPATVEHLLAFKAGDFIALELAPLIQAKVDGAPVFDCHYGTSNHRYSLKVDQLLTGARAGWLGEQHHV